MRTTFGLIGLLVVAFESIAPAQTRSAASEHWVATWATSQPIAATSTVGRGGPPLPAQLPQAQPPQAQPKQAPPPPPGAQAKGGRGGQPPVPSSLNDQTIRMVVHTSIGGGRVRIELSNAAAAVPLVIGAAHIALRAKDSAIVPGTDRKVTFSGQPGCTIRPGVLMLSDPVEMEIAPLSDLAISLYVPKDSGPPTNHNLALHTGYISKGDTTAQEVMPEPATTRAYLWLSAVDVTAAPNAFAIVALGDSITDGQGTTLEGNLNWTAVLARRLAANKATAHIGVVNQGVQGNQVLRDDAGVSALARFDRDVLSRSGVKWIIFLQAINDIVRHGQMESADPVTSDDLIAGYRQIIARAHTYGIRVMGATVTPAEGQRQVTEGMQAMRTAVNQWIRTSHAFDAVVDFDAAVRDPEHPLRLREAFDSGDHIHLSDAGNQAMADAIDLTVFKK